MCMFKFLKWVIILSFLSWIISSCKKDAKTINTTNNDGALILSNNVYAGIHDTSFNYYELQPALEISIVWDNQNLYGYGSDSLDIDSDGNYDLFITLSLLNEDSLHLLTGMPNPFPYCRLDSRNGLEIAFYTESFYIGLG